MIRVNYNKETKRFSINKIYSFSKTANNFFLELGNALQANNKKAHLVALSKKYDLRYKDLEEAIRTYIKYDPESNGLDELDIKHILKELGF